MRGVSEWLKIVLLCTVAAVVYGIAHDMVTAHLDVRYFTEFHPRLVDSESPIVMAGLWGVIATWWMGTGLGVLLALASWTGPLPRLYWRRFVGPVAKLLVVMAIVAAAAGMASYMGFLGDLGVFGRYGTEDRRVLTAILYAHNASYLGGFFGGLFLCYWAIWKRTRIRCRVQAR